MYLIVYNRVMLEFDHNPLWKASTTVRTEPSSSPIDRLLSIMCARLRVQLILLTTSPSKSTRPLNLTGSPWCA